METRSYWRIFTDAGTAEKARRVFRRVQHLIGRRFEGVEIAPHHECGFVVAASLPHAAGSWPEVVVELLECTHRVSVRWSIGYDTRIDLTTAATQNALRVAGVTFIHVECGR